MGVRQGIQQFVRLHQIFCGLPSMAATLRDVASDVKNRSRRFFVACRPWRPPSGTSQATSKTAPGQLPTDQITKPLWELACKRIVGQQSLPAIFEATISIVAADSDATDPGHAAQA